MKNDAIVSASLGSASLKREQKLLLAEAQRRARDAMERAEGALAEYGQWLFETVFLGETQAVLDREAGDNDLYRALLATAGTLQMPIAKGSLSATVRIAAFDKRLADASWSRLRFSHKEKLLVLGEPNAMRLLPDTCSRLRSMCSPRASTWHSWSVSRRRRVLRPHVQPRPRCGRASHFSMRVM